MRKRLFLLLLAFISLCQMYAVERTKLNFNGGWLLKVGDFQGAELANYKDAGWKQITLPRAFNEKEAFKVSIEHLSDTIMWYRKHFHIQEVGDRKYFIEFEGVRFGADIWLNGKKVGYTENGVMASGFDLTPYIIKGENVIAVRVDNSWNYRERTSGQRFQWNDKNFNANYGGIPKNVFLHITDKLYQTLPLYNNLKTTGIYIYGSNYDIAGKKVTVNAESQVRNEDSKSRSFRFFAKILDADGKEVGHFDGERYTLKPGETKTVKVSGLLNNAHFWSWGYGYLYTVKTLLKADDGSKIDDVVTKTGFRKTQFGEGKFYLNDRAIMMHGYAQRTSNEWPGVGMSVPAWLSDYSNKLMVESGGNLVRWMHVCPWKQDIESCDRVGLIQAMPAGDAEKDGLGFSLKWNMGWMNDFLEYMKLDPYFRKFNHNKMTFSMTYAYSERYVLGLSHDEVVHLKCSMLEKMPGEMPDKYKNLKAAYSFMTCHPGKKLLFMGQEFGQLREWSEERELDWFLLQEQPHQDLRNYVKDLLTIYKKYPALYATDNDPESFEWINANDGDRSIFSFIRKSPTKRNNILYVVNFTPVDRPDYRVGVPKQKQYKLIMDEHGLIQPKTFKAAKQECDNRPYSFAYPIPAYGVAVFVY